MRSVTATREKAKITKCASKDFATVKKKSQKRWNKIKNKQIQSFFFGSKTLPSNKYTTSDRKSFFHNATFKDKRIIKSRLKSICCSFKLKSLHFVASDTRVPYKPPLEVLQRNVFISVIFKPWLFHTKQKLQGYKLFTTAAYFMKCIS